MKYYCNPLNLPYKYQYVKHTRNGDKQATLYREAADPSLILFKGKYFMFPSMTAGFFTSEDLLNWDYHAFLNNMPIYDYAPDVCVVEEYLYFSASRPYDNCSFYRTKDPLTQPFEEIKGSFAFWDPHMFRDDDGRLYFYWGCNNMTPIYGVELDPDTMKPLTEPIPMFGSENTRRGYERIGNDHVSPKTKEQIQTNVEAMVKQLMSTPEEMRLAYGFKSEEDVRRVALSVHGDAPYIEGAWMTKYNGKYYLQYAGPGTEYNIYSDGVYIADYPLGPYKPAENNPYSYHIGSFIQGAGHGSTLLDKQGRYWHISTCSISMNDAMERRLGLWKAGFDKDSELYCDQRYGDWPIAIDAGAFSLPEWVLLSYGKKVVASGGIHAENVTDEDSRTWWKGTCGDCLTVDLGSVMRVNAIQINFADDKILTDLPSGASITHDERFIDQGAGKTQWLLEGSKDGENYITLCDKCDAETDLPHDFLVWEDGYDIRFIKLTVISVPYGVPCVSGIRIFGKAAGAPPHPVKKVTAELCGDLDMEVRWERTNAIGYNVLWGHSPDKLYHSCMVYGTPTRRIGALIKDQPLYLRVDAFNESGIAIGADIIKVK